MKGAAFLPAVAFTLLSHAAEIPIVHPVGIPPDDARLGALKDLDGYFPFTPPASRDAWEKRAAQVRMQMRVALGLWPEPERTPLNAVVHGRLEQDDFTVEKVFFESMPGFFVTGSLFRPKGKRGPFPAVLCPHGHWKDARFWVRDDAELKRELETGAERLTQGGRSVFQSLGVQLARMGCVALVYDMIGHSDCQQLSYDLAHRFAKQRPEMNAREGWGLYSPQAEAHAQGIMGLQTWNSIRALDFLTSLPDVDARRLACTGASGGGTQTLMVAALDPRLAVECPAVMTSTAMQGGCTCENASLLRIGTGNVEFAALFAPKPLGMTAANDWTKELETKGFPELKKHYALMGAPDRVALWAHLQFGHNYNAVSRGHIYAWFNKHLGLGLGDAQLLEREYPLLTREQLTVWDAGRPAPPSGDDFEKKLLRWWDLDAQAQLTRSPEDFARIAAPAWQALVGWQEAPERWIEPVRSVEVGARDQTYRAVVYARQAADLGYELPEITIRPAKPAGLTVLWLHERGKAGLFTENGELREEVVQLLEGGASVVGVDLIGQGEFLPDGRPIASTRVVKNPRESASFTFGYNHALFAQRVHDVSAVFCAMGRGKSPPRRAVIALDGTGPIAAVALAIQAGADSAVLNTGGFRFGDVLDLRDPNFLPAAAKYGDLPGAIALLAAQPGGGPRLLLRGEGERLPAVVEAAYRAAGAPGRVRLARRSEDAAAAVTWVLGGESKGQIPTAR